MPTGLIIHSATSITEIEYTSIHDFNKYTDFKHHKVKEVYTFPNGDMYLLYMADIGSGFSFNTYEFQQYNPRGDVIVIKRNQYGLSRNLKRLEFFEFYEEVDDLDDYLLEDELEDYKDDETSLSGDFIIEDE